MKFTGGGGRGGGGGGPGVYWQGPSAHALSITKELGNRILIL